MERIIVYNADKKLLQRINEALDDKFIDYDFDSDDRYMIDEDDVAEAIRIMESIGADVDII